jgi:deazaflavin-dependent oxidoreductase (nitroreductase family)
MYRMAKQYRVNAFMRINNAMTSSLLRLGVNIGSFALLTVRGRKSGKPIETPIAIFDQKGTRYLIATYGEVNWVRNLRAARGEATITRSRSTEKIHAIELPPEEAAPIFREAVRCFHDGDVLPALYDITDFDIDGYQYSLVRSRNWHYSLLHGTLSARISQICHRIKTNERGGWWRFGRF